MQENWSVCFHHKSALKHVYKTFRQNVFCPLLLFLIYAIPHPCHFSSPAAMFFLSYVSPLRSVAFSKTQWNSQPPPSWDGKRGYPQVFTASPDPFRYFYPFCAVSRYWCLHNHVRLFWSVVFIRICIKVINICFFLWKAFLTSTTKTCIRCEFISTEV